VSTLRVGNLEAPGGTGTITVPTGNTISQTDTPPGLVFIYSSSFSAVSSVSMPAGTFTTTYSDYQVLIELTDASANATIGIRVNNAGSARTGSNYNYQSIFRQNNGFSSGLDAASQTSLAFSAINSTSKFYRALFTVSNPTSSTIATRCYGNIMGTAPADTTVQHSGSWGGVYTTAETNDGLTVFPSTGNITGRWVVYGMRA
jgi:hypothetical protein